MSASGVRGHHFDLRQNRFLIAAYHVFCPNEQRHHARGISPLLGAFRIGPGSVQVRLGVAGVKNFKLGQSPCLFELCHWAFLVNALKSIDDSTETIIIRHRVAQLRSKAMSAIGTKRTCESIRRMSAFGGKADMAVTSQDVRL
jgi:hypothetical protein